jgi:hypothetical protein
MRLYFKPGELLLEETQPGEYVLRMGSEVLGTFKQSKRAIAEYNRVRRDFEKKLPPLATSDEDRRMTLERYLADGLVQHNSFKPQEKKSASKKTRTFG